MRIATYYGGDLANAPDEIIEVDNDIADQFLAGIRKDIKRDNKRHGLTDRLAEIDAEGEFIRWIS